MKRETSAYPLSIITINLNNRDGLEKTIESVVHQTYRNFEYIVVDGASTDGSVEVIQRYEDKINYWVSEPDSGIYNAMNKGIRVAQGEYLLFLNSGDFLHNRYVLQKIIAFLSVDFGKVLSGNLVYTNGIVETIKIHPEKMNFNYLYHRSISHPSTFIHSSLFKDFGLYEESFRIAGDWAFFFKAVAVGGASYRRIPEIISVYNTFGISSDNRNLPVIYLERKNYLKKLLPSLFFEDLDLFQRLIGRFDADQLEIILESTDGKKAKIAFKILLKCFYFIVSIKRFIFKKN